MEIFSPFNFHPFCPHCQGVNFRLGKFNQSTGIYFWLSRQINSRRGETICKCRRRGKNWVLNNLVNSSLFTLFLMQDQWHPTPMPWPMTLGLWILQFRNMVPCLSKPQTLLKYPVVLKNFFKKKFYFFILCPVLHSLWIYCN